MQFIRISGITVTCSPTALLGTNHIERNKAVKTLFLKRKFRLHSGPLFHLEHADVCLSLAGGPKVCNLFLDLARFAIKRRPLNT